MASKKRTVAVMDDKSNSKRMKIADVNNSNASTSTSSKSQSAETNYTFLDGIRVFILPAGIQKSRLQLFKSQLEKYGAGITESLTRDVTHIIVDDAMTTERMCKIMKMGTPPSDKVIVKSAWLSACFRKKESACPEEFYLLAPSMLSSEKACETKSSALVHESQKVNQEEESTSEKTVSATIIGINNDEIEPSSSENKLPKVGVMWNAFKSKPKGADDDSDYCPSDGEVSDSTSNRLVSTDLPSTSSSDSTPNTSPEKKVRVEKWICAQSSKAPNKSNLNENITAKLEEMARSYESTSDKWRAFGYQKAIAALRRHPKQITSWEEARSLQGVGAKLADKIWEIAQSGELRKLTEFKSSEQVQVLKMFTDVWGAGPTTANAWYQQVWYMNKVVNQVSRKVLKVWEKCDGTDSDSESTFWDFISEGFRTLGDLKTKANLTHQQKVGVRIYDDLLDRMPREEAAEIETVVREAAESLQPGIIARACGSYRRGKKDCGDVDVLVTHPDGRSEKGIFAKLLRHLKETGFLTDDLVSTEDNGNQKKYLGVCKLPGPNRKYRRLDIIVVPYEEYACALVYFTGSAHFNRSLRHLCKKMDMSLNEHALRKGVVRQGQDKIFEGTIVHTPTEESVLAALSVPYRPPEERDH